MRIVVSNPDTLGDFVLRQPLFAALHNAGHELLLIVRPATLPLVQFVAPYAKTAALPADPYKMDVEAQWPLFERLEGTIRAFGPDLFVVAPFQWTDFEEAMARRLPQVHFAGLSGRNTGYARRDALQTSEGRTYDLIAVVDESTPELEKNQALARVILDNNATLSDPAITLTPAATQSAREVLKKLGLEPGSYCAVCVTGTANVSLKAWPTERWAEVLSSWMQKHGTRILFTAPQGEAAAVEAVRAGLGRSLARSFQWIDATGAQLETLIGLIGLSNGYIGHDTGPMHIAAALGKPVLAVFGGGHWPRFLPAAKSSRVLTASVPCVGCGWNCPFEKPYCVHSLQSADVLAALNDLTESSTPRRETLAQALSTDDARAMLEESGAIAARERRELTRQLSTVSQREAELGVLKGMVRETAAAAESNRMAAVERLAVIESLDVELTRARSKGETLQSALASLAAELNSTNSKAAELSGELNATNTKAAELSAQNAGLAEKNDALNLDLRGARIDLAARDVDIACLKEKTAADARRIEEQSHAYGMLMNDRNAWVEIYKEAEAKLKKIDDLYWYERIWDTIARISKFALYGRQYVRRPDTRRLPTMTIVTPVFNCAAYIRDTIESVLSQNYPRMEYIIVDGGSTDGTLQIIEEYRGRIGRIISEPDNGMYDAVGKGFDSGSGEILAYLNADDMYEPGALLRAGEYFRAHPNVGVIYHENTVSSNGWRFASIAQPHVDVFDILRGHVLFQDGVFFRREKYYAAGAVNRSLRGAGDWALWLEMALWFKLRRLDGHVSSFRVRPGQISENMDAYRREQDEVRRTFKQRLNLKRIVRRLPRRAWTVLRNARESIFRRREFFYPVDFPNMPPPPGKAPSLNAAPPVCPLSGAAPDRLLLSARHPMLADLAVNHIYFKDDTRVAFNHPSPNTEQSQKLREQRFAVPPVDWNKPPDGCAGPNAPYASPYAKAQMRGNFLERALRKVWCARVRPNMEFPTPAAAIQGHILRELAQIVPADNASVRFLDASCYDGSLLDAIARGTKWRCAGAEPNPTLSAAAGAKGHRVLQCTIDDAPFAFPMNERFDIIHVGESLPSILPRPVRTLNALQSLLAPGGVIVIGSPNLDSKQQEWFGPAWSHWHLTRFHALYSRKAFERLAEMVNMSIIRSGSFSHAEWIAFSMHFQVHGLAWSTPHICTIPESAMQHAGRLERLIKNFWDVRGKGDYISAILRSS